MLEIEQVLRLSKERQRLRKAKLVVARRQRGFTLIELIVATAIMTILVGAAVPLAKNAVYREREHELRYDLWMIRDAVDRSDHRAGSLGERAAIRRPALACRIVKTERARAVANLATRTLQFSKVFFSKPAR